MSDFDRIRRRLEKASADRERKRAEGKEARRRIRSLSKQIENLNHSLELLQAFSQSLQRGVCDRFETAVNLCLRAIFPNPYKFEMVAEFKRSQMEVRLVFIRDDIELSASEIEGGVLDVVSFVLRLVCVSLGGGRRLLVLDEPFKFVDEINRQNLRKLLDVIAESMDFRMIIVTHLPELIDDEATLL